jgi:hypothetical protein
MAVETRHGDYLARAPQWQKMRDVAEGQDVIHARGPAYPGLHKGMLWLQDVPNFTFVYIHTGNKDEHTMGCLLVGGSVQETVDDMAVWGSRDAYRKFYQKVVGAAEAGALSILYVDKDSVA